MKIVRIVLLSFMLCYFANANEDNSGFIFGGQIAYAGMKYDASAEVRGASVTLNNTDSGISYGLLLGYQHFFNDSHGLRAYVDYNINAAGTYCVNWNCQTAC